MNSDFNSPASNEKLGRILLVIMTVVGYTITFSVMSGEYGVDFTFLELFWGIGFGLLYLLLAFNQSKITDGLPNRWGVLVFFAVECALIFGIGWVLGPGGNWLIGLPLAGTAVEILSPRRRWLVYIGLVMAGISPVVRSSDLTSALNNAVIIGATILFVVSFTQSRLNEQKARENVEKLMAELEEAHNRLAAYAGQIEELATTQERNRLAREIHDNLGHYLTIVNVQIEAAKVVMESEPERALNAMNKAQELTQKGLTRVRESVEALRESPVSNRSLEEAIASLVKEMDVTGVMTDFQVVGDERAMEEKVALALYRVAQEGLTNIRKHAQASTVNLWLDFSQADKIHMELKDDGVGAADTSDGFGLVGIRERIHLLGGEVQVVTEPDQGFAISATIPCEGDIRKE